SFYWLPYGPADFSAGAVADSPLIVQTLTGVAGGQPSSSGVAPAAAKPGLRGGAAEPNLLIARTLTPATRSPADAAPAWVPGPVRAPGSSPDKPRMVAPLVESGGVQDAGVSLRPSDPEPVTTPEAFPIRLSVETNIIGSDDGALPPE